jgi:hypothetical protein
MTDVYNIPIERYRDSDGRMTCAYNRVRGSLCILLRSRNLGYGREDYCGFTGDVLTCRDGGYGSLIPCAGCPLWPEVDP